MTHSEFINLHIGDQIYNCKNNAYPVDDIDRQRKKILYSNGRWADYKTIFLTPQKEKPPDLL